MEPSQDYGCSQLTAGSEEMVYSQQMTMDEPPSAQQQPPAQQRRTTQDVVMAGIEKQILTIVEALSKGELPILVCDAFKKRFTLSQARSFTGIVMVYSFVYALLQANRTTTTREVYYFYVTFFANQRECDAVIMDAANLLGVSRMSMGLYASPKGWFCGSIEIIRDGHVTDATALSSVQGLPITREWIDQHDADEADFQFQSDAKCILVIEKEGVYIRLSEDRFFERVSCILITGKGFPDLATRALVHSLANTLDIPVYGLCDCNPFGLGVLHTYEQGSRRMGVDGGDRYHVPIHWIGLRPSYVQGLQGKLPADVYQRLTDVDKRRLDKLCDECHPFHNNQFDGESRLEELHLMQSNGCKVELEALNWLGMDYTGNWLEGRLVELLEDRLLEMEESETN